MDMHADLMRQGFMKQGYQKPKKQKPFDEAAWARRCVEASRKRYVALWGKDWAASA